MAALLSGQIAASFDSKALNLILLPTEQCNFRCSYCYEAFDVGMMSPDVVAGVKHLLQRRVPELRTISVSWFGGEPLLGKPIIVDVSRFILDLIRSASEPVSYFANMTTNGYLLDVATADLLVSLGVTFYQVSIDGPEEIHDRTRVKANGDASFDRIWRNLLDIRDSDIGIQIMIRVHYAATTWRLLDRLVQSINDEFSADPRFTVYFKSIDRLGGPHDADIESLSTADKVVIEDELRALLRYPEQIYKPAGAGPYICYASSANSLLVRANGDLGKCTVGLYDERNRIGTLRPDGTVAVNPERLRPWLRGFASLDEDELACPYQGMDPLSDNEQPVVFLSARP